MERGLPEVGEVVWHGDKAYSTCFYCEKLVRLNKSGFGSMHVCLSPELRAALDSGEVLADYSPIRAQVIAWDKYETELRKFGAEIGIRKSSEIKIEKLSRKLRKKNIIDADCEDGINELSIKTKQIKEASYRVKITEKTLDQMAQVTEYLSIILSESKNKR